MKLNNLKMENQQKMEEIENNIFKILKYMKW